MAASSKRGPGFSLSSSSPVSKAAEGPASGGDAIAATETSTVTAATPTTPATARTPVLIQFTVAGWSHAECVHFVHAHQLEIMAHWREFIVKTMTLRPCAIFGYAPLPCGVEFDVEASEKRLRAVMVALVKRTALPVDSTFWLGGSDKRVAMTAPPIGVRIHTGEHAYETFVDSVSHSTVIPGAL